MQTHELSVLKSSLTPAELSEMIDRKKIGGMIAANIGLAQQASYVTERRGIFQHDNYASFFSLTGSMRVPSLDSIGTSGRDFFTAREDRFSLKPGENGYYLRGLRHIVAIDPNKSLPQKLEQLRDDYTDGVRALSMIGNLPERQHFELAPIIDYIKIVTVTTFNGLVYNEKIGDLRLNNEDYQAKRRQLSDYMRKTVRAFYHSLLGSLTSKDLGELISGDGQQILLSTIDALIADFSNSTSSYDSIVRPESTHPLTILGTAYSAVHQYPDIETVVGLPAGSTELACAVSQGYELLQNKQVDLVLLPFSLHTRKPGAGDIDNLTKLIDAHKLSLTGKNVLLIDDNTSTGRTLQNVSTALRRVHPQQLTSIVSEADIIRSRIDRDRPKRSHVADPIIYNSSIGVLPVSRVVRLKHDLKELMEQRQYAKHYLHKAKEATDIKDVIKYEVFAEGLLHPINEVLEDTPEADLIDSFEDTWLSNFHSVPITYNEQIYPSVEHAYQAAKFTGTDLDDLSFKVRLKAGKLLEQRGYFDQGDQLSFLFTNPNIDAGTIKLLSTLLQEYVPRNWDDQRVDVMISLLVQKFQVPELANNLLSTGNKILVEGNTWNGTFWGFCNNQGRSMLGRLLMNIREKIKAGLINPTT